LTFLLFLCWLIVEAFVLLVAFCGSRNGCRVCLLCRTFSIRTVDAMGINLTSLKIIEPKYAPFILVPVTGS
jgi:hypothetical protein